MSLQPSRDPSNVLDGTTGVGGMVLPTTTKIYARMKCVFRDDVVVPVTSYGIHSIPNQAQNPELPSNIDLSAINIQRTLNFSLCKIKGNTNHYACTWRLEAGEIAQ